VKNKVFPGLIPAWNVSPKAQKKVQGVVLYDLTPDEMRRLDWFEDKEYTRKDVSVSVIGSSGGGNDSICGDFADAFDNVSQDDSMAAEATTSREKAFMTQVYLWSNPVSELDLSVDWSYERFRCCLASYLENTVQPCRDELDRLKY